MKKTINCSALEKEVVGMRNSLKSDRLDMSFGEVMATYDRDELLISPDFQRLFRWDLSQRTKFIESILLGMALSRWIMFNTKTNCVICWRRGIVLHMEIMALKLKLRN